MTITKSPSGYTFDCEAAEADLLARALSAYSATLRLASQTELPDVANRYFAESETCDELAAVAMRGIAGK